ncbi:MAG: 16S rRNA (guanine(966)-N(2))-methyltransferase RsmD [Polyangiaceae bacterium]
MRVTGGRLGGRTLRAPRGDRTRPTTDRVRESLFQILGDLDGRVVLDLFAGTGALGIEALSRGAARATLVEQDRSALAALRENLEALDLGARARVLALPVERALARVAALGPYDLVLLDPPWVEAQRVLEWFSAKLSALAVAPTAQVVLEHRARAELRVPAGSGLELFDERVWGDTAVSMFSVSTPGKG